MANEGLGVIDVMIASRNDAVDKSFEVGDGVPRSAIVPDRGSGGGAASTTSASMRVATNSMSAVVRSATASASAAVRVATDASTAVRVAMDASTAVRVAADASIAVRVPTNNASVAMRVPTDSASVAVRVPTDSASIAMTVPADSVSVTMKACAENRRRQDKKKSEKTEKQALVAARSAVRAKTPMANKQRKKAAQKNTLQRWYGTSRNFQPQGTSVSPNLDLNVSASTTFEDVCNSTGASEHQPVLDQGHVSFDATSACDASGEICVLASTSGIVHVSSNQPPAMLAELSLEESDGEDSSEQDGEGSSPPRKKTRSNEKKTATEHEAAEAQSRYDRHRKFKTVWQAKLPWSEGILSEDGVLHLVKCVPCSAMEKKQVLMAPKFDTLLKHDGKRTAKVDMPQFKVKKGEQYIAMQCKHRKNLKLYASRPLATIAQAVQHCSAVEHVRKRIQFATIFQVLSDGQSMLEYESRYALYKFLNLPNLPSTHWSDSSGWILAEFMYRQVSNEIMRKVRKAKYLACTVDEVTTIDNGSWLSVHLYVVEDWIRVPLLVALQRVEEAPTVGALTRIIMDRVELGGGISQEAISSKLLSFGSDGASAMSGCRTGVSTQIVEQYAPFCTPQHCLCHKLNLALEALSKLPVFHKIELLLRESHSYFCKSPKRYIEFRKLAELTETKGLKLLRNVETRWVSLIEPLRRLLSEYRTLILKMYEDLTENDKAEACLKLLLDPYTLVGMLAFLPLMETMETLMKVAQGRDIYVCDFISALQTCISDLSEMYEAQGTAYKTWEFWSLNQLLEFKHESIHLKWWEDNENLNLPTRLAFMCEKIHIFARQNGKLIDTSKWMEVVIEAKQDVRVAAVELKSELLRRFPSHGVMNAMGILYPQYWTKGSAEAMESNFPKHLRVLSDFYGHKRLIKLKEGEVEVPAIIDRELLMTQQRIFKTAMKCNSPAAMQPPFVLNPLTSLWRTLDAASCLTGEFSEYFKLAEMAVVHILGSVEDERCFSSVKFLKSKVRNALEDHLQLVVGMFSQSVFSLENFPYDAAFQDWLNSTERFRYGLSK